MPSAEWSKAEFSSLLKNLEMESFLFWPVVVGVARWSVRLWRGHCVPSKLKTHQPRSREFYTARIHQTLLR